MSSTNAANNKDAYVNLDLWVVDCEVMYWFRITPLIYNVSFTIIHISSHS